MQHPKLKTSQWFCKTETFGGLIITKIFKIMVCNHIDLFLTAEATFLFKHWLTATSCGQFLLLKKHAYVKHKNVSVCAPAKYRNISFFFNCKNTQFLLALRNFGVFIPYANIQLLNSLFKIITKICHVDSIVCLILFDKNGTFRCSSLKRITPI